MRARELVIDLPSVRPDSPALEAARLLAGQRLPGLVVLDAAGRPATILPGVDVLRTAVRSSRAAIATVIAIVTLIDVALIAIGALGAGAFLDGRDWLRVLLLIGGIVLLAPLGVRTLREGIRGQVDYADLLAADSATPPRAVVGPVLALSLLNPHVYLDTVAILGSAVAATAAADRASFAVGAMIASAAWFLFLGALGSLVLRRYGAPVARAVDLLSGTIMLIVAAVFAVEAIRLIA